MLIYHFDSFGCRSVVGHPYFLIPTVAVLSYLLIAELPMFSLKFARFQWQGNEIKFIFAAISLVLLLLLREAALVVIILFYVLISIVKFFSKH